MLYNSGADVRQGYAIDLSTCTPQKVVRNYKIESERPSLDACGHMKYNSLGFPRDVVIVGEDYTSGWREARQSIWHNVLSLSHLQV